MQRFSFGVVLKALLLAVLLAGTVVAAFHLVFTEPLIDQAIGLEDVNHTLNEAPHAGGDEPIVSRNGQKIGLFVGYGLYGLSWALLLSVVFHLGQGFFCQLGVRRTALLFGFLVFWACALMPFLKYPANPPGVGEPDTVNVRQQLYIGIQFASAIGVVGALALGRWVAARWRLPQWVVSGALLALSGAIIQLAFPAATDPIRLPMELVNEFRAWSLAGLSLYWLLVGLAFGGCLGFFSRPSKPATKLKPLAQ
ncbi:CbtA family protein [Herpetosiphon llansteffanensis]|uniref:CbtA family protein n=1 Tax=Herpetosiphon llansteffanensis TaxID=2094568 RepID=UPI000D7C5C35|nr:CbtA family protein [Herpetosiphon llansteffanensis]